MRTKSIPAIRLRLPKLSAICSENLAEQSYSERQIYEQALDRLANEVAVCENISSADATKKLLDILAK